MPTLTFEDVSVVEPYSGFIDSRKTQSTKMDYRCRLNPFYQWLERRKLDVLTASGRDLLQYVSSLGRTNSQPNLLHHVNVIRSLYRYLLATEQILRDPSPVFDTLRLRRQKPCPRPVDHTTQDRILKALRFGDFHEIRVSLVVLLGVYEGLRIGEIANLRWENVDFDLIPIGCKNKGCLTFRGKCGNERQLPLHPLVRNTLLAMQRLSRIQFGLFQSQNIFRVPRGGIDCPPSRAHLSKLFHEALYWAGLSGSHITPHTLRHTFATRLAEAGRSVYEIRDLLGQSSIYMSEFYVQGTQTKANMAYAVTFGLDETKGGPEFRQAQK